MSSSSSLDHSSDEILDALEMAQDLGSKVDLILARLLDIDKKLEQINSSVSNLENKLDKMDNRVQHLEEAQSKTSTTVNELQAGLTELNTQVNEAKTANEKVKEDCEDKCKALEDKLLYAEVYSRRENLRFFGIDENSEREDSREVLQSFLERELKVKAEDIEFQRVHRVGKTNEDGHPRPIIARFLRYSDRESIFSKAKALKGTGFGISADLPREIVRRRKLQGKKLRDARKDGKLAYFSRVEPDKLYIDRVLNPL